MRGPERDRETQAPTMNRNPQSNRRSQRDPEAIAFAREQRATANEFAQDLWQMVRNRRCLGYKFRREYPIPPYTVDFCCVELKLVLEVDGAHHLTEEGQQHDVRRDRFLAEKGHEVLRIRGYDVLNDSQNVRRRIEQAIATRSANKPPHPQRETGDANQANVEGQDLSWQSRTSPSGSPLLPNLFGGEGARHAQHVRQKKPAGEPLAPTNHSPAAEPPLGRTCPHARSFGDR